MPTLFDEYYLDYKNVDEITSNIDGSVTVTFFNKRDKNLPGNSVRLSSELVNGWKTAFKNIKPSGE